MLYCTQGFLDLLALLLSCSGGALGVTNIKKNSSSLPQFWGITVGQDGSCHLVRMLLLENLYITDCTELEGMSGRVTKERGGNPCLLGLLLVLPYKPFSQDLLVCLSFHYHHCCTIALFTDCSLQMDEDAKLDHVAWTFTFLHRGQILNNIVYPPSSHA